MTVKLAKWSAPDHASVRLSDDSLAVIGDVRDSPSFIPRPDTDLITFCQTFDWPAFGIEFVSSRRGDLDPEFLTMAVAVVGVSIADELTHLRPLFAIAPICVGLTEPDSLGIAYSVRIEDRIVGTVVHVIGVIEVAGNHPRSRLFSIETNIACQHSIDLRSVVRRYVGWAPLRIEDSIEPIRGIREDVFRTTESEAINVRVNPREPLCQRCRLTGITSLGINN
ncbi:hypothetical protein [Brevibacterium aurantiacum]|uniref:hypothetical protein n=1 Tax=Brevibacterium aurantiacum TaxID=273384 RepID=UPI0011C05807|nr:hypothetical protein [Brevibacterium aurantiacum]